MPTRNVNLTAELERFILDKVESGRYENASEVVRAALRTLEREEQQFEAKLLVNLKPRLETLVDHKVITQTQADRALDRIAKGHVPFWDGVTHRKK